MKSTRSFHTLSLVTAICSLLLIVACTREQQEALKLEAELVMEYSSLEFTVVPTEVLGEVQLTIALDGDALARTLTDNGYSMDQLKEFKFTSADVRITGSSEQTYDPLQRASLELALDEGTPQLIASKDPVPEGAQAFSMDVQQINVADIVRHSNIQVIAKLTTDQVIQDTMHHVLDLGGKVVVQL